MRYRIILAVLTCLLGLTPVLADETPNERQAKRIFDQAYQQVFGEEGATLHYDVNIIGLYKTSGTIWFKGKKSKFVDAKTNSWNDGTTIYTVRKKKPGVVEIHNAQNNKSDKFSGKFKFAAGNYTYHIESADEGLLLTLKAKKGAKGIKELHLLVKRGTYEPVRLRAKVAFIWANVKISDFKSGGITDETLRFPSEKYQNCKYVDKR